MALTRTQSAGISTILGAISGVILSVIATLTPFSSLGVIDLVVFLSIPALSGLVVSLFDSSGSTENAGLAGLIGGLAYVVMAAARLSFPVPSDVILFLVITVPIWGVLALLGSMLAGRTLRVTTRAVLAPRICGSCKTPNPADAQFCKNCGTKLA